MTKISVMRRTFEGTDWKRAFAEAVIRLRPDMNPDRADELSDTEYLESRHVDPAVAAVRWFGRQESTASVQPLDRASNGE